MSRCKDCGQPLSSFTDDVELCAKCLKRPRPKCTYCGRNLEPIEYERKRCKNCAANSVRALTHDRIKKAEIFDMEGGGPSIFDLEKPAKIEEPRREFESGWSSFVRDDGDTTALNLMQLWVDNLPILVVRFGNELNLIRFKEIPTAGYKEIPEKAGDQYLLLSNGPLIRSDRRELGPSVREVTGMARSSLPQVKDPQFWLPGDFRKKRVLILTLTRGDTVIDTQRLLQHLESLPN